MTFLQAADTTDFDSFLTTQQDKDVLRFITCGSVDDGKSTLIGRLLHDTKQLFDDQLANLRRAAKQRRAKEVDFASLLDGLAAEREQGITIDVAYRFFATRRRTFIVADTPGHEQYTRNMATGASTADLAVLLVDARKGLIQQTRRHSLIVSMLGIRHVVLAVNKMDLVGWSQDRFEAIVGDYRIFSEGLDFVDVTAIPLSALNGDNVVQAAVATPWHKGPTLVEHLETVAPVGAEGRNLTFPVQRVARGIGERRGYAGRIASGAVAVGDAVSVMPDGTRSKVARIVTPSGERARAVAGQSITLWLETDIDVSRGTIIVDAQTAAVASDRLAARIFWIAETPLRRGAQFELKLASARAIARVVGIESRIDPANAMSESAESLAANDIGEITLSLDRPIAVGLYHQERELGGFILIDRDSAETAGIGLVVAA